MRFKIVFMLKKSQPGRTTGRQALKDQRIGSVSWRQGDQRASGRSMIEMLGVLAVIGVLSIGALMGFQYAMNKHRANETIHDVMLRASNVPMEYEDYDQPHWVGKEYLFPSLENQSGTLSTMGYPMKTYRDTAFGYVYRVDVTSVPEKVCTKILRLEPADIDEIRVGTSGQPYTRGAWDLCKNQPANEALMVFLFEKHCQSAFDCSACQRCLQGRCKADYDRPGCSEGGCLPGPSCGRCEAYEYDETGCPVGCKPKGCGSCSDTQKQVGTDICGCPVCVPKDCPEFEGCGTCQTIVLDERECPIGCQVDETCCIENGGHLVDLYGGQCCETKRGSCCSTDEACVDTCVQSGCCPDCDQCLEFKGCGTCTSETTDEQGCPTCQVDESCCLENGGTLITNQTGTCCEATTVCCSLDSDCTVKTCEPEYPACCAPFEGCSECENEQTDEHGCSICVDDPSCFCPEGTSACGEENCCVDGEESCLSNGTCCPSSQVCEQTCCGAGQGCVDGLCQCVDEPDECGPCEELQTNPDTGCKECILPKEAVPCGVICCEAGQVCTNNETACCKAENVCGDTCCPDGVACDAEKGVCGCSSDADCCPKNPCMKCVQNETLGVGECQMVGSLYNSGSGLSCCTHPNRAYFSQFSASGCDDTCFNGHPNEQTVCGQTYGVGNSCCPSALSEETPALGVCGSVCMEGSLGAPALSKEGNLSCCGFDSHVCPVKGLYPVTGLMETKCCLKGQAPYYSQNDKQTHCCDESNLRPVTGGTPGAYYCCDDDQIPYWNGSSVACCNKKVSEVDGMPGTYACCEEYQDAYYGKYYRPTGGIIAYYVENGVIKYDGSSSQSTGTFCCSNDPTSKSEEKVCCSVGDIVQSYGEGSGCRNVSVSSYSCAGQEYCDLMEPGSSWTHYEHQESSGGFDVWDQYSCFDPSYSPAEGLIMKRETIDYDSQCCCNNDCHDCHVSGWRYVVAAG